MASLADLANNLPNYQYYSGLGNFTANNLPADSGQAIVKQPGQKWSLGVSDSLTPFGAVATVNRTLADVERVSKFLYTTSQGPQFLIKQTALQFENVNIEHSGEALPTNKATKGQGFLTNIGNSISNFANKISNDYGPTRIYNPLGTNTLAEVGVVASGLRFTKHGLLPAVSKPNDYADYIYKKDKESEGASNRLFNLTKKLISTDWNIMEYKGGPGSIYGIGSTTIKRAGTILAPRTTDVINTNIIQGTIEIPIANMITLDSNNHNKISKDPSKENIAANQIDIGDNVDFRAVKNIIAGSKVLASSNYKTKNMETRVGLGRARKLTEDRTNYASADPGSSDKVNKLSLFYGTSVGDAVSKMIKDVNDEQVTGANTNDLIKFRIKSYDNDATNGGGVYMIFRAYMNNIKRNMQAKWNPYNYVGRGESFYLYDGFTESISFQFTIAASSRSEMKAMYQKLNYLMSTLTPDYNKQNRMRGNISELTIGDFVKYQPGIITNLDIIVDDDYNWEIAMDEGTINNPGIDYDTHELPHMLKCNMTFIPIYNFLPRKSAEAPFIGIDDTESKGSVKDWTRTEFQGINSKLKASPIETKISNQSVDIIGSNPVTSINQFMA